MRERTHSVKEAIVSKTSSLVFFYLVVVRELFCFLFLSSLHSYDSEFKRRNGLYFEIFF